MKLMKKGPGSPGPSLLKGTDLLLMRFAQAVVQPDGVGRADLHTAAARHAFLFVDPGAEIGGGKRSAAVLPGNPESAAETTAAVADIGGVVEPLGREDGVDEAGFFGFIQHLDGFFPCDPLKRGLKTAIQPGPGDIIRYQAEGHLMNLGLLGGTYANTGLPNHLFATP